MTKKIVIDFHHVNLFNPKTHELEYGFNRAHFEHLTALDKPLHRLALVGINGNGLLSLLHTINVDRRFFEEREFKTHFTMQNISMYIDTRAESFLMVIAYDSTLNTADAVISKLHTVSRSIMNANGEELKFEVG